MILMRSIPEVKITQQNYSEDWGSIHIPGKPFCYPESMAKQMGRGVYQDHSRHLNWSLSEWMYTLMVTEEV